MESQDTSSGKNDYSHDKNGTDERPQGNDSTLASQGAHGDECGDIEGQEESSEQSILKAELAEFKDRYMRLLAEVENMRRRMEREKADLMKFAFEGFFKDLLPALDSLEKALPSDGTSQSLKVEARDAYFEGMLMVKRQLLDILKRHGLEKVESKGAEFDPNLHQAIQRVESKEATKDMVQEEFALGYTLHGRLLRPAMVSVLTPTGADS